MTRRCVETQSFAGSASHCNRWLIGNLTKCGQHDQPEREAPLMLFHIPVSRSRQTSCICAFSLPNCGDSGCDHL